MRTSLPAGSARQKRASSLTPGCLPSRDLASKVPLPPLLTDAHLQPKQWILCGEKSGPHRRRRGTVIWAQARLNLRGGISEVSHSQTPFVHLHTQVDGAFGPKSFLSSCRGLGTTRRTRAVQLATFIFQLCVESFSEWGLEVPAQPSDLPWLALWSLGNFLTYSP